MDTFDINNYLDMAWRRKYWVIIPFMLTILAGLAYALVVPKIYEAETLILIQPQKVPQDYVRSIVSGGVEDRLKTITQQVTSRTNLEKIIKEYNLYGETGSDLTIDDKVKLFKKRISLDVSKNTRGSEASAFRIAFRSKDPKKARDVTNALASNYIRENLRIRESQAMGTSTFLSDELVSVKERLMDKEEELKGYRERYMGGLPEHLNTNLRILERLQTHLDQLNNNLRDAENRKIIIQQGIAVARNGNSNLLTASPTQSQGRRDLTSLKNELASLEARYTANHPDIIRLKETIASLEQERLEAAAKYGTAEQDSPTTAVDPTVQAQLKDVRLEINGLKSDIKKTQSEIAWYQKRVDETPKREQELLSLTRDYENLKELYHSLSKRKLEADIAVSMERKQKGEQFRVIDPAKEPTTPVEPNIPKIILLTLVLGLGLGLGLGYVMEMMDTSYRIPDEVEADLQYPILVSIPFFISKEEDRKQKIAETLKAASVAVGFVICAVSIVLATKGIDKTVNFAKTFLTNLGVL